MPRTTQAEFRLTRQKIVEAASVQIRAHGMHGVSLAKVMHEVGQTVGGYYNHFPSRQALVVEAFELAMNEYYSQRNADFEKSCISALVGNDHPERPRDLDR
jgi:AcrR family transcriptional regulator